MRLVAVSKTFAGEAVREAVQAGLRDFGENYVTEGVEKIRELRGLGLIWHYVGPIQSNKTRLIAEHFDWVHAIDREKIAARFRSRPAAQSKTDLQVCIQVNVSGDRARRRGPPRGSRSGEKGGGIVAHGSCAADGDPGTDVR